MFGLLLWRLLHDRRQGAAGHGTDLWSHAADRRSLERPAGPHHRARCWISLAWPRMVLERERRPRSAVARVLSHVRRRHAPVRRSTARRVLAAAGPNAPAQSLGKAKGGLPHLQNKR